MNKKSELFDSINLEISIVPFTTEYRWVQNKNCHNGSYKRSFKVKKPMLKITFFGITKQKLKTGSLYIGTGDCVFYASSENMLINKDLLLEKFTLPNAIVEISKPYSINQNPQPVAIKYPTISDKHI
jgi:hypothetical protein